MENLLKQTQNLCQKLNLRPDVRFMGQHFLVNDQLRDELVAQAPSGPVVEIGPGLGVLTKVLVKRGLPLVAVELDQRLEPVLLPLKKRYPNLKIIIANILKLNFYQLAAEEFGGERFWLFGIPPYQLVEPLMIKLGQSPKEAEVVSGAIFLISQRSAQEMIKQKPPRRKLAVLTNALFEARIIKDGIGKESFWPQPRTTSAIISLISKPIEKLAPPDFIWRYLLVRPGWKTKNALREGLIAWSREQQSRYPDQKEGLVLTKNQGRGKIRSLGLSDSLLETPVGQLGSVNIEQLDQAIFSLFPDLYISSETFWTL